MPKRKSKQKSDVLKRKQELTTYEIGDVETDKIHHKDEDVCSENSSTIEQLETEHLDTDAAGSSEKLQTVRENDDELMRKRKKREKTPGVIYLSSIPEGMQYNDVYKVFSELGDIGRISLQTGGPQPTYGKNKKYAEGWVEFLDKKKAKRCVLLMNNQLVGGKKRSKWYDCIWHMRYLPRFQWSHLTERLAYEQASMQQRMRSEINQAKQEAQHFAEQIDWKQKNAKMASKHADWKQSGKRSYDFVQKSTDDEIRKRKAGSERVKHLEKSRSNVLSSLFAKS